MKVIPLKDLLLEPVSGLEPSAVRSSEILAYFDRYSRTRHRRAAWLTCVGYVAVCAVAILKASLPDGPRIFEIAALILIPTILLLALRREIRKADRLTIPERLKRSAQHEVALVLGGAAVLSLGFASLILKLSHATVLVPPPLALGAICLVTIPGLALVIRWVARAGAKYWDPYYLE